MAYYRLDQLVDMLAVFSPTDETYLTMMRKLINIDVLIIDDFMTMSINQRGQEDLAKIIFDREGPTANSDFVAVSGCLLGCRASGQGWGGFVGQPTQQRLPNPDRRL